MESDRKKNRKDSKEKPLIGITCGDLNGIGIEVTMKALMDNRVMQHFTPVILASAKIISFYRKHLQLNDFSYFHTEDISKVNPKKVNILNIWKETVELTPGVPSDTTAKFTLESLNEGVRLLKEGSISALVTAPLNKALVQSDTFDFPGHTEFFASAFDQKESLMFMVNEDIRIGVATGHMPLSEVPRSLNSDLILKKSKMMLRSLKKDFGIKKPRLAIMGLNPHAGEDGLLGTEEKEIIIPTIEKLKEQGHIVFGPFPADGFFGSGQYANFDGILAMYHDQGLIPFKHIAFGGGVNFTAGLPCIRTSPDHGTAYNLVGKNVADPSSMMTALYTAVDIARSRIESKESA